MPNLELKNWVVDWQDVDATALLASEAMALYENDTYAPLPQELKEIIDHEKTKENILQRLLLSKIVIYVKEQADRQAIWRVQKYVNTRLGNRLINNRPVRCTMQASDEMKPLTSKAGKFYGFLEAEGSDKNLFKVQYFVQDQEFLVRFVTASERPARLAKYSVSEGWHIFPEVWARAFPEVAVEEGHRRLSR